MLTKGDLVRVPQASQLTSSKSGNWHLLVLQKPKIAIVLRCGKEKSVVLLDNVVWEVKTKDLQLYGGAECL